MVKKDHLRKLLELAGVVRIDPRSWNWRGLEGSKNYWDSQNPSTPSKSDPGSPNL